MKKSRLIAALALGVAPFLSPIVSAAPNGAALSVSAQSPVSVALVGEVAKPGNYGFKSGDKPTLISLVVVSGGLTKNPARVHIKVQRGAQNFNINIADLLKFKVDFALQDGDLVTVTAYQIGVWGYVKNPGYYSLPDSGTLSIADALMLAGGGEAEVNEVIRMTAKEEAKMGGRFLPIPKSDFNQLLQDGDTLYVLNSKAPTRKSPAPAPPSRARLYLLSPNSPA